MDNETILRRFDEIEDKLEKVVAVCKSYEAVNLELKNKIVKLEGELQEKIEKEKGYLLEKNVIRSKIDSLLSKLDVITGA